MEQVIEPDQLDQRWLEDNKANPQRILTVRSILEQEISPSNFKDPVWFIGNMFTCVNKDGKHIKFEPNDAQCCVLHRIFIEGDHKLIILKARQLGMSTLIDLIGLWYCIFNPNSTFNILSHTDDAAKELLREKVLFPFESMDPAIKASMDIIASSANEIVFSPVWKIRSRVKVRGGTSQVLHISEWGKVAAKDAHRSEEILTGALPTVGPNGYCFIESTFEGGKAGHFYNQVIKAMTLKDEHRTEMDFKFVFFPWFDDPTYTVRGDESQLTEKTLDYFKELTATLGRTFTTGQMIWWQKKAQEQGIFMGREYPSTPEEAMNVPVVGAIYADQLEEIKNQNRIRTQMNPLVGVPIWAVWDIGFRDSTAIWLVQWDGREVHWLWHYENSKKNTAFYLSQINGSGYDVHGHILPHDACQMDKTGTKNYLMEMSNQGARNVSPLPKTSDIWMGINELRSLLYQSWFNRQGCALGITLLSMYRTEIEESKGGISKTVPVHDHTSHTADAARYVAEALSHGYLRKSIAIQQNPAIDYQPPEVTNGY